MSAFKVWGALVDVPPMLRPARPIPLESAAVLPTEAAP